MRSLRVLAITLAAALASALAPSLAQAADAPWVSQVGTYDALVSPDYSGKAPIASASTGQSLGLGTFDDLDGELVMVGGVVYRVGTDGVPRRVDTASATTPFFQGIDFTGTRSAPVGPGTTCASLVNAVNELIGGADGLVAVRVRGTFTDLVTRSVPRQAEPYRPLSEIVATQTVFALGQRRAVLVGFRNGADYAGVGAPGLHLHAVTADRTAGGHVLSCVAGPDVQLSVVRAAGVRVSN